MFRKPGRTTEMDSRVEEVITTRLDDCDRLDDVVRALMWLLERLPDNDRSEHIPGHDAWIIKTEALPGLESPAVTLIYRFDDASVTWGMIRIECDEDRLSS